jgi:uroporphyrinogen decarboxylase
MFGDQLCFHGGVGVQDILPSGTPQQVKTEVRRLIREVGADGGFILSPAHTVMADVPVENMVALIETVQEQ